MPIKGAHYDIYVSFRIDHYALGKDAEITSTNLGVVRFTKAASVFYENGVLDPIELEKDEGISFMDLPHKKLSKTGIARDDLNLLKDIEAKIIFEFLRFNWVFECLNHPNIPIKNQSYVIVNYKRWKGGEWNTKVFWIHQNKPYRRRLSYVKYRYPIYSENEGLFFISANYEKVIQRF